MYYQVAVWPMLHSTVKCRQNTRICRKWKCKAKFHMPINELHGWYILSWKAFLLKHIFVFVDILSFWSVESDLYIFKKKHILNGPPWDEFYFLFCFRKIKPHRSLYSGKLVSLHVIIYGVPCNIKLISSCIDYLSCLNQLRLPEKNILSIWYTGFWTDNIRVFRIFITKCQLYQTYMANPRIL